MDELLQPHAPSLSRSSLGDAPTFAPVDQDKLRLVIENVKALVAQTGLLPEKRLDVEIDWFFNGLGIDQGYFLGAKPEDLADHVVAIYGAKVSAKAKKGAGIETSFQRVDTDRAFFFHTSHKGLKGSVLEKELDDKFLDDRDARWRLESYRSVGRIGDEFEDKMRCYLLKRLPLTGPDPEFETRVTEKTRAEMHKMLEEMTTVHRGIVIRADVLKDQECRIEIAYKRRTTSRFFSSLSDLYHFYDMYSTAKYLEPFDNGITVVTLILGRAGLKPALAGSTIGALLPQLVRDISLLYVIPDSPLHSCFREGKLSIQEVVFSYCAGIHAQHFFQRLGESYDGVKALLNLNDVAHQAVLEKIRGQLRASTMREKQIWDTLYSNAAALRELYTYFSQHHMGAVASLNYSAQSSPLLKLHVKRDALLASLAASITAPEELQLFQSLVEFADSILKTNFFKTTKTALSFRLDPKFLRKSEFPEPLFGMFLVVGSGFRGFHLRFQDIARGGIRLIQSRSNQIYEQNLRSLFDENYNLASTQQKKNKDIPEGGSSRGGIHTRLLLLVAPLTQFCQGTILMKAGATPVEGFIAFKKYVHCILDLLESSPEIVDKYRQDEILFFGPDEGTSGFMDWASQTAKKRGFSFWKALTTGKSTNLGGIPHDLYGMTTRSIHQYVVGVLRILGVQEQDVTKLQTGGPDGDLGSNEIKISHDKTVAIVDGSGVVYDPAGLDRAELVRLANARQMVDHFNLALLKQGGFRVLVTENNVTLPDGTLVPNGMVFRNDFHLNPLAAATLFVPCGGRPEAVKITNVHQLYDAKTGKPRFRAVVEGANLFFSEQARLRLEADGVILFKDASANKGGVTSSSLEVLAGLALSDAQWADMCTAEDGRVPDFRAAYVEEVIKRIELNARNEFECLWKAHCATKEPLSTLSNKLSLAINKLTDELSSSTLWDDLDLRNVVLAEAIPPVLLQAVGLQTCMERVPLPYLRAMFSSYLASSFVYEHGIDSNQLSFFLWMSAKLQKARK